MMQFLFLFLESERIPDLPVPDLSRLDLSRAHPFLATSNLEGCVSQMQSVSLGCILSFGAHQSCVGLSVNSWYFRTTQLVCDDVALRCVGLLQFVLSKSEAALTLSR